MTQQFEDQQEYLDSRRNPYEGIRDSRTLSEKVADANWRPVLLEPDKLPYEAEIAHWEQQYEKKNGRIHTLPLEKRLAEYYRQMQNDELDAKDAMRLKRAHDELLKPVVEELTALNRRMMADKDSYDVKDFVLIAKGLKQSGTVGGDPEVAKQFLAQAKNREIEVAQSKRQSAMAKKMILERELEQLNRQLGDVPAETDQQVAERQAARQTKLDAAKAEWNREGQRIAALIEAGQFKEADAAMEARRRKWDQSAAERSAEREKQNVA